MSAYTLRLSLFQKFHIANILDQQTPSGAFETHMMLALYAKFALNDGEKYTIQFRDGDALSDDPGKRLPAYALGIAKDTLVTVTLNEEEARVVLNVLETGNMTGRDNKMPLWWFREMMGITSPLADWLKTAKEKRDLAQAATSVKGKK